MAKHAEQFAEPKQSMSSKKNLKFRRSKHMLSSNRKQHKASQFASGVKNIKLHTEHKEQKSRNIMTLDPRDLIENMTPEYSSSS